MKTKKFLSILLTIAMALSMMATLGINASAGKLATWVKVEKYGKTFWYRTDKVTHNDNENEESWDCECWNLIVGKFSYEKPGEFTDGGWYDEYPCDHIVTYEPLTSLVMKSNPTKTDYAVGDTLDLTGAKMTATTISETTEDVNITSSMVSGFDSTTSGIKTVTVTYRNLTTSFDVTVAPKNECYLDLDSTTAIPEKKELDQNYNLTVTELPSASGTVTKVKLSWEINDINAVRMDNKVWDTTELKWVVASSNTTVMDKGTAKFTLENYSSDKIDAAVSFKAEGNFKGTASYDVANGKVTLDTANGNSTYSKTNVPKAVINATVNPGADDFKTLDATSKATKYGTYTVTIAKHSRMLKITFSSVNPPAYGITINGNDVTVNEDNIYSINSGDVVAVTWDQDRTRVTVRKSLTDFENTSVVSLNSPTTTSTSHTYTVPNDDYNYVLDFAPPMT